VRHHFVTVAALVLSLVPPVGAGSSGDDPPAEHDHHAATEHAADIDLTKVGTVEFATSASSPEAQAHFLRGVAALHSFGWKQAIAEFEAAQKLEPDFAMAYWGQSLCYNHPLFSELDPKEPRKVLARLGDDAAARAAKAPTEREEGFLAAVEALWGEGTSDQRKVAYSQAMERLYQRHPGDDEVATFYALSLLSAAEALGNEDLRHNVRAGSIALEVFARRPDHPGAPHYVIHAFDDPVHAPLALDAARRYAEIAPAVSHARHMPSHIFIQRGMWNEVSASNVSAFEAARDLWEPGDAVNDLVHSLDWGQYGDLQRGDVEQAKIWREKLETIVTESKSAERAVSTLPLLDARVRVETESWQAVAFDDASPTAQVFTAGLSAAKLGDVAAARRAAAILGSRAKQPEDRYEGGGETARVMQLEVLALVHLAKGRKDAALAALEQGRAIAESWGPPAGPASPPKPIHELYGEVLLEIGRPEHAIELFRASLDRTPNRPLSLRGLARAQAASGQVASSRDTWSRLLEVRGDSDGAAGVEEARRALSGTS
jgi:tetratricopeptide (TPR) repeat protein